MYEGRGHNDPLVGVHEPLYVSVSVELGGVVAPRPDQPHWLGGQVGRQQGEGQHNFGGTLCNTNFLAFRTRVETSHWSRVETLCSDWLIS